MHTKKTKQLTTTEYKDVISVNNLDPGVVAATYNVPNTFVLLYKLIVIIFSVLLGAVRSNFKNAFFQSFSG